MGERASYLGVLPSCTAGEGRGASVGLRTVHGCTSAAVDHTGSVGTTCVSGSPSLVRWPHVPSPSPLAGTGDRTWSKDWVTSLRTALTPAPQTLRAFRVIPETCNPTCQEVLGRSPSCAALPPPRVRRCGVGMRRLCIRARAAVAMPLWSPRRLGQAMPCWSPVGRRPFAEMCRFQTVRGHKCHVDAT